MVSGSGSISITFSGSLLGPTCTLNGTRSHLYEGGMIMKGLLFGSECVNTVCSATYRDSQATVFPTTGNGLSGTFVRRQPAGRRLPPPVPERGDHHPAGLLGALLS